MPPAGRGVTAPTLVVDGDQELAYRWSCSARTAGNVPDGRLFVYAGRTLNTAITARRFSPTSAAS